MDASNKKSLIGIFDLFGSDQYPAQRQLQMYARLGSAFGHYEFSFRFVRASTWETIAEVKATTDVEKRGSRIDFVLPPLPVTFPEPGVYEFQLWANDAYLGCATIDAIRIGENPS